MYIDVRIPYEPGKKLGHAYNRAMETVEDWVLFLDHDVYLLNPHWYEICLSAIETLGHRAAFITCKTNRIGCRAQKAVPSFIAGGYEDNLPIHEDYSRHMWRKHGSLVVKHDNPKERLSGFFLLTNKLAWALVGGFREAPGKQFLGVDNDYHRRILEEGFEAYIMPGLYVYHGYKRLWKPGKGW